MDGSLGSIPRREVVTIDDRTSTQRRYYISDLDGQDAQAMLGYVRGHWGIENKLHWSLDMTFREDALRIVVEPKEVSVSSDSGFAMPWMFAGCERLQLTYTSVRRRDRLDSGGMNNPG